LIVRCGPLAYEWIDGWGPQQDEARGAAWPHHGIVASRSGEIIQFDAARPILLVLSPEGALRREVPAPVPEAHGITANGETLWLADAGNQIRPERAYAFAWERTVGEVVHIALTGEVLLRLEPPPLDVYGEKPYRPTAVAIDPSGAIWVGDGYGAHCVHQYGPEGSYRKSIDGSEGAGRFATPHFVYIDIRRSEAELYVCDRGNARIQVYGLDGGYRRQIDAGILAAPTWIARDGDRLVLVEFKPPRLTVLDRDDQVIGRIGENEDAPSRPGWPNDLDGERKVRTAALKPGRFNSPHAVAVDPAGDLYVTEWLIGGRTTKLKRVA
jgi:DNA-binding beta-propeller fold protein YncE